MEEALPIVLKALLLFGGVLVFALAGVPLAFSLGIVGVIGLLVMRGPAALAIIPSTIYDKLASWTFSSLPEFIMLGAIVAATALGAHLFEIASKWLGRVRGALAMASIIAYAGLGSVMGAGSTALLAVTPTALPEMLKRGYNDRLAIGTLTAGCGLASLIPPSIAMIVYGFVTEVSLGRLFMGGVIPGLILATLYCIYIYIVAGRPGMAPAPFSTPWRERIFSLRKAWPLVVLAAFTLGGVYIGFVTPTEAGGIATVVAMLLAAFHYRQLGWKTFLDIMKHTVRLTGFLCFIIVGAVIFSRTLALAQVPQLVMAFLTTFEINRWVWMVIINIWLLFLGCFLDGAGMILLTVPVVYPSIIALGFDPIWFGIVFMCNIELAVVTPPVGTHLYVMKAISGYPLSAVIRSQFPFWGIMLINLGLIIAFPILSLWLPGMMY